MYQPPFMNPGAGGPIHGQQVPAPVPNGQFPLNPGPVAQPLMTPPQTGSYYPGAAGAPSGVHPMTPGVQAVSGAIGGLPGVLPSFNPDPHLGHFDRSAYRDAVQNWRDQRVQRGQDQTGFDAWRQARPDRGDFPVTPVA